MSKKHFCTPKNFDINRLIIESPKQKYDESKMKKGGVKINPIQSLIKYKYPDGIITDLLVLGERQFCYGIQPKFPYGYEPKDRTSLEKSEGLNFCYYLTSNDTTNNPTEGEQALIKVLDSIQDSIYKLWTRECMSENTNLPKTVINSYKISQSERKDDERNKNDHIKKFYYFGKDEYGNIDETKPKRIYCDLKTFFKEDMDKERNKTITRYISTRIILKEKGRKKRISGDELLKKYLNERIYILPVFQIRHVHWGSNDKNNIIGYPKILANELLIELASENDISGVLSCSESEDNSSDEDDMIEEVDVPDTQNLINVLRN